MKTNPIVSINSHDVEQTLASLVCLDELQQHLENAKSDEDLLKIFARFTHFASVFGGSQTCLAGAISVRQDLFRVPGEALCISDNCSEVATSIFFGSKDEFDDRQMHRTHRALGQAMLKGLTKYMGISFDKLDSMVLGHKPTREIIYKVFDGFGVNMSMDEEKLFNAFGFYVGTEMLADMEFNILNTFFQEKRPDVVRYLKSNDTDIDGISYPSYFWVERHTAAEEEHFDVALDGANRAIHSYAGEAPKEMVRDWVMNGIKQIALLEKYFLDNVTVETV